MLGPTIAGYFSQLALRSGFMVVIIVYSIGFLLVLFGIPSRKNPFQASEKINHQEIELTAISCEIPNVSHSVLSDQERTKLTLLFLFGVLMYAVISKFLLGYFPNYADRPTVLNWSDLSQG